MGIFVEYLWNICAGILLQSSHKKPFVSKSRMQGFCRLRTAHRHISDAAQGLDVKNIKKPLVNSGFLIFSISYLAAAKIYATACLISASVP